MSKRDQYRSEYLIFAKELRNGELKFEDFDNSLIGEKQSPKIPSFPNRIRQKIWMKQGKMNYEQQLRSLIELRNGVVKHNSKKPRLLVRVDEFPHFQSFTSDTKYDTAAFRHFHTIMKSAEIPYLIAALPQISESPLDPKGKKTRSLSHAELETLSQLQSDGVCIGLHGLNHRTRYKSSRRRSELLGLNDQELERYIEQGLSILEAHGIHTKVFVPPYNRFSAQQYQILDRYFDVICGGPESVAYLGFQPTPQWRGDAVYLPSYPPLYGKAQTVLDGFKALEPITQGLWLPVTLHWGWEADIGWKELERMATTIAPYTHPWFEFLDEVEFVSRH